MFKSNIKNISRRETKSEGKKSFLQNIKLLYESRETAIKLFNDYFSISSETKCKTIHEKGIQSLLGCGGNVSDHSHHKILSPKQMLQWLPMALAHVKAGNKSDNFKMKS